MEFPQVSRVGPGLRRSTPGAVHLLGAGLLICALVLMPGSLRGAEQFALPKEMVLGLSAFAALVASLTVPRSEFPDGADLSLALFFVLSLVSAVLVADNGWMAARALGLMGGGVSVFYAARAAAREDGSHAGLSWVVVVLSVAALGALLEAYGPAYGLSLVGRGPGGTLGNRNVLAHLLALGLPVYLFCALRIGDRRAFALVVMGLVPVAAALTLTRCRAAWLACVAMLLAYAAASWAARGAPRRRAERGRTVKLAVAALLGISLAVMLPNRLEWSSRSPYLDTLRQLTEHRTGSGQGRLVQYRHTLDMIRAEPVLGVGPGNWGVQYPRYASVDLPAGGPGEPGDPVNRLPSSDWINIGAESGLPALLALVLWGMLLARAALRRCSGGQFAPGAALLCTLAALAVLGSVDNVLARPASAFMAWFALGILTPLAVSRPWPLRPTIPRWAKLAAVAFLGVALTVPAGARLYARYLFQAAGNDMEKMERATRVHPGAYEVHLQLAFQWTQKRECKRARMHVEAARRLFPHNPDAQRLLVVCRSEAGDA